MLPEPGTRKLIALMAYLTTMIYLMIEALSCMHNCLLMVVNEEPDIEFTDNGASFPPASYQRWLISNEYGIEWHAGHEPVIMTTHPRVP